MKTRFASSVLLTVFTAIAAAVPATQPAVPPSLYHDFFTGPSVGHRDEARAAIEALAPLSKADAAATVDAIWAAYKESPEAVLRRAASGGSFVMGENGETLHYVCKTTGERGPNGYAAYIDMHGGGEAPPEVNTGDWKVHQTRYTAQGKFFALRAPRDTWDQFHNEYFHTFLGKLVEQIILADDVDPNRIYLMGYSSGGYGVIQLAPAMPDRFAAAACSAAATEGSRPENLRDLPFIYQLGENDTMYDRGKLSREYGAQLAELKKADPEGYDYEFNLIPGHGHGFDDRGVVAWMTAKTREPYPTKIVWWQNQPGRESSNPIRHQMYWVAIDPAFKRDESGMKTIEAVRNGQQITLAVNGYSSVRVRLDDAMVDLDKPVLIVVNGKKAFEGVVPRSAKTMLDTFLERKDPTDAFSAEVNVDVPAPATTPTTPATAAEDAALKRLQESMADSDKLMATLKPAALDIERQAIVAAAPETIRDATTRAVDAAGDHVEVLANAIATASPTEREDVAYLISTMPAFDRQTISSDLLVHDAQFARQALLGSPWGSQLDYQMYQNYILPYASIDERRDDWRPQLFEQLHEQAWKFKTPLEAARWISDNFEKLFGVTYNAEKRPKPDQSPFEAMQDKYSSCTGLSILMVDACRAVGIPARMVGVPRWTEIDGNHNWVEVWDGQWFNMGDSGTDPRTDNWVTDRASKQTDPDAWMNSVYALCWRPIETHFPIIWKLDQRDLPALNVTRFYSHRVRKVIDVPGGADSTVSVYWAGELIVRRVGHGKVELPLAGGSIFRIVIRAADGTEKTTELRT